MEAAGLAVGVVGFGLQLATTLQTYVEGVAGAEGRLRELSFDVASTASTLKQLEDMLEADKSAAENTHPDQGADSVTIFTEQGRRDIYSLSRRSERVYLQIVRAIVDASKPPSSKSKEIAANVGLSDLTATRLVQLTRNLKWPWVEPRVKACQEELRWLKMDLLLHLQVATVAKIHLKTSKQGANWDDESAHEAVAVAERLISRRTKYRKAVLETRRQQRKAASRSAASTRIHLPEASQQTATRSGALGESAKSSNPLATSLSGFAKAVDRPGNLEGIPDSTLATTLAQISFCESPGIDSRSPSHAPVSDEATKEITRDNPNFQPTQSQNPADGSMHKRSSTVPVHDESDVSSCDSGKPGTLRPSHMETGKRPKIHNAPFDVEAWTLPSHGADSRRLPFARELVMQRLQQATDNGRVSAWDRYLGLAPHQRDQIQDVLVQSAKTDARARSYLALEARGDDEIVIFVAVNKRQDLVYLTDHVGRTWQFPYKDFNSWEAANRHIQLLETKDASLQHEIAQGHFDISVESGALIPPVLWHFFVKPGRRLDMELRTPIAPPGTSPPRPSFGKRAFRRLLNFRVSQPRYRRMTTTLRPQIIGVQTSHGSESSSSSFMGDWADYCPIASSERKGPEAVKDPEDARVVEVEDDEGYPFEFEDGEEDIGTSDTFDDLLARWTNVKR